MKKTKIEHRIPDKNGISKQYPKVMKYPERHGFIWESNASSIKGIYSWQT